MVFGAELRQRREKAGISLRELAHRSGISPPYLSDIERGFRPPPSEPIVKRIAETINWPLNDALRRASHDRPIVIQSYSLSEDQYDIAAMFAASMETGLDRETLEKIREILSRQK